MDVFSQINKPTLLLDVDRSRANIHRLVQKAKSSNIRFRPHFKTHQSAEIGTWFLEEGVNEITVSSIDMAAYFAQHGWKDITVAFPFNWRQLDDANALAERIHLGLLVESVDTVQYLGQKLLHPVDIWIKIDVGAQRTGIVWQNFDLIQTITSTCRQYPKLCLRGILTHAGQTYHASSQGEIMSIFSETVDHMTTIREHPKSSNGSEFEISVGDTPGCSLIEYLENVDEIRPGNFIFYDVQQLNLGVCSERNIAVAVACPVVATHPERDEVIIYGGAIHLSKEFYLENGHPSYGRITFPQNSGWSKAVPGAYVTALSQEHGVVHFNGKDINRVHIGDLLIVLPVHSCLVVSALRKYLTLSGNVLNTMTSEEF